MLSKTPFVKLCGLVGKSRFTFAFKKFDFEDGLNLKSLLTEEEVMVIKMLYRSWKMLVNLRKLTSSQELFRIIGIKHLILNY